MARRAHAVLFLALAAPLGCAHAPAARAPRAEVVWPAPPATPRVRLAALFPDPDAPPPPRSRWRALLELVTGIDPEERKRDALVRPFGVAVTPDGATLVADPDAPAVVRVDAKGAVSRLACKKREWSSPMAVAPGPAGAVYVVDAGAAEIVRIEPDGRCAALGAGSLERPVGVAVDGERLVVVDPPRHRLVVLSATTGEVLARWGALGEGDGDFHFPTAVARAPDGGFLVVDALNFRVVRLSRDGRFEGAFGTRGDTGAAFARPKAVAVDDDGRVYVTDAQRDLVLVFRPGGELEYTVGDTGAAPGRFTLPAGVAVEGGRLLVADSQNHRIQTFQILGGRT